MNKPTGRTRFAAFVFVVLCLAFAAAAAFAGGGSEAEAEPPADSPRGAQVPLAHVVLFSSGVSYYQRDGEVSGDQTVDLYFRTADINDLLKSMVVQDLGGGAVAGVSYSSKDPLDRSLKGLSIDLSESPGLAAILEQTRGEPVEVYAPERIAGVIVGVEERMDRTGHNELFLNLMTDYGLRSARLSALSGLRFTDRRVDGDLREALSMLAASRDRDRKRVSVALTGYGTRKVRIGYLLASPVWKTSYRLVLGEEGAAVKPFLQGWGIVENTTDETWKDVSVTLVSGRPISFVMDLYQPLYVERPQVQLPSYSSLRPQRYEGDLGAELSKAAAPSRQPPAAGRALGAVAEAAAPRPQGEAPLDLTQGVQSVAQTAEAGSFFQYSIDRPVTLARHESAMLPIVSQPIEGSRVSIYNQSVLARHPLLGVKLRNTTGLDLMAGPITVFDGGVYAGDARIDDLGALAERLVSYAVDLKTEVATSEQSSPEDLVGVRIAKGTLVATRLQRRARTYTIKRSGGRPQDLLIEHPVDPNWELVSPESAAERTRDSYRFAVKLGADATTSILTVAEKRMVSQTVVLSTVSDDAIAFYIRAREVSPRVKEALSAVAARKSTLAETVSLRQEEERKQQQISSDQARLRENMARLERDSALYKRYVSQLESQETELAAIRGRIDALRSRELEQRKALDETLRSIDVE